MIALASRRALLGTLAALPFATCAQPVPATTPLADRQHNVGLAALQAKIATHGRLYREWEVYYDNVAAPTDSAHSDGLHAVAHLRTTRTYETAGGRHKAMSTDEWTLGAARRMLGDTPPDRDDYAATLAELIGLHEQRDRQLEALAARLDVDAVQQRESELAIAYCAAAGEVAAHPSAAHAELMVKLRFIFDYDWWEMPGAEAGVKADVARLTGEVA